MYDTEMRMTVVEHRVAVLRRKHEKRLAAILSMLCLMLTGSISGIASALADGGQGYVPGLYGSTMLFENAGGYVLVGVLAFSAAVVITVLCIRYREKKKKDENSKEDEE
jgi:H+/Cl- antiporter ClcA